MKISRPVQFVLVASILILLVALAFANRYQNVSPEHRIDRWTGKEQEFYKGQWMLQADYEAFRDNENKELREHGI